MLLLGLGLVFAVRTGFGVLDDLLLDDGLFFLILIFRKRIFFEILVQHQFRGINFAAFLAEEVHQDVGNGQFFPLFLQREVIEALLLRVAEDDNRNMLVRGEDTLAISFIKFVAGDATVL